MAHAAAHIDARGVELPPLRTSTMLRRSAPYARRSRRQPMWPPLAAQKRSRGKNCAGSCGGWERGCQGTD